MQGELNLPSSLEIQLHNVISKAIENAINKIQNSPQKEWMTLKEGAEYAGVSFNTFKNYRLDGLRVFEKNGTKRVSKTEIDNFLNENSF
ncbi:helix-turn-helix domain-containing protein [Lysinibacillus capsici]|uniref:helix-turn-helix domain-containing protein n=1 Tax=Lysinibacillus capsici TaxID=2115968 RepID=UPI0034E5B4C6